MKWSREQGQALTKVGHWLRDKNSQLFHLFGYAGTGKTTLVQHFAEGVGGLVLFGAYTGKAAHVLKQKGCVGASTIHSMIYQPREKSEAKLRDLEAKLAALLFEPVKVTDEPLVKELHEKIRVEKEALIKPSFALNEDSLVRGAALVIIDECSMVDSRIGQDLLSFGTKVLVLGDPAQLPPVRGHGYFIKGTTPDIMIKEIHRQASDNPIIALATLARKERPLPLGQYGESAVIYRREVNNTIAQGADQILVGRNTTRRKSNVHMRELLGKSNSPLPVKGDKLVCLRNNIRLGLLNGALWEVKEIMGNNDDRIVLSIKAEDNTSDPTLEVEAHTHHFLDKDEQLEWNRRKAAEEFDYGYALTVHKAQGSQWDDVLLFNESSCFRGDRWKWLYTGITRAVKTITIAQYN